MQRTYVFGHKNPDTDSVCASISMAYLKNQLGENAQPRVLGSLSKETKFVLDYFKIPEPQFLNDVKVQIRDMHYEKTHMIDEHASIYETYRKLSDFGVTGLPLIDKRNKLTGYVNVKEISKYLIDGDSAFLDSSYDNILKTLNGKSLLRFDHLIKGNVLAAAYKSETFIDRIALDSNDILIVGDRYKILEYAVSCGIKLLILVNNMELPSELYELAEKNRVNVISVPMGTFKCSNMIKLCNFVKLININSKPITFSIYDFRDDFIDVANKLGHTNYPIVDKKNTCLGMLKLIDANTFTRKKVILVDHNQQSQSVDGIDEANILEVIDHHNLGTIGTTMPISFRSMPVGCTCTVIYKMFQESNIPIPKDIAGIMLSAILSDTLMFKSPTTTDLDKETGKKLAKIAGIDIDEYGLKMFKAASTIAGLSVEEVINSDFKSYKYEDSNLAISQIMTMDFADIKSRQDEFVSTLDSMCNIGNYKFAVLFITDIIQNGSYLLFNSDAKDEIAEAFNIDNIEQGVYLDGIVSRKKQMLPPLLEMLERRG